MSSEGETRKQADEDSTEDLELGDEDADKVVGGFGEVELDVKAKQKV